MKSLSEIYSGVNMGSTAASSAQSPFSQLMTQYQTSFDQAKAANENRYQQILAGYDDRLKLNAQNTAANNAMVQGYQDRYSRIMAGLDGLGQADRDALGRQYTQARAKSSQDLISRGLNNTTVRDSVLRGLTSDESNAQMKLSEQLRRERLGYDTSLSGDLLGAQKYANASNTDLARSLSGDRLQFMERRTDAYPNDSTFLQLAQMAGTQGFNQPNNGQYRFVNARGQTSMFSNWGDAYRAADAEIARSRPSSWYM